MLKNVEKFWKLAMSFEEYMADAEMKAENPQTDQQKQYQHYYQLGVQRMHRTMKVYTPDEKHVQQLQSKNFGGSVLIISEAWCGDASSTVPVLAEFFAGKNEVRIFLRDHDRELIENFKTGESLSIPKVLILNEDCDVIKVWGPRTAYGNTLLQKFKENPEAYPRDEFYNDLQVYYAKNKGKDLIEELLQLF